MEKPIKFTAIYIESWTSGSHQHSITKMKRIEQQENDNTILDMLKREGIDETIQYLFVGWPKLQGEKYRDVISKQLLEIKE